MSMSGSSAVAYEYTFIKRAHALFTSIVTLGAAMLFLLPDFPLPAGFLAICITSSLFHALLYLFFDRATPAVFTLSNVANLVMLALAIHFTGGILSPFTMVFALVLISGAGYGVNMSAALAVSVGAYCGVVLAEKTGFLMPVDLTASDIYRNWPATLLVLLSVIGFMASSGSIYKVTVNNLRQKIGTELEIKQSMANRLARLDAPSQVGLLVNKIVNEVNGPLTTVNGFLQVFRADTDLSPDMRQDCHLMIQEISRINRMLSRMVAYTKSDESGRQRLCPRDLVETVLAVISFLPGSSGISVYKELIPAGTLFVFGNKQELHQVVFNILKNAIEALQATPGDRIIRVHLENRAGTAVLTISDNGTGIPKSILDGLGKEMISTKPQGAGIGLIVANEIVKSYKGRLSFESVPNGGTTVKVTLPTYQPAKKDEQEARAPANLV
jgi:signal transduction histidine kinase